MRNWKTKYTKSFQVRTTSGRKVGEGCSIEHVEFIAEKGRGRSVWKWSDQAGKYRHYKTY